MKQLEKDIKTKNRILEELYNSQDKMSVYELYKKLKISHPSILKHINHLEKAGIVKTQITEDKHKKRMVELPNHTREFISKIKEIKNEILVYCLNNNSLTDINQLKNEEFLDTLSRLKEYGLVESFNLEYTEKGKLFLGF